MFHQEYGSWASYIFIVWVKRWQRTAKHLKKSHFHGSLHLIDGTHVKRHKMFVFTGETKKRKGHP